MTLVMDEKIEVDRISIRTKKGPMSILSNHMSICGNGEDLCYFIEDKSFETKKNGSFYFKDNQFVFIENL